MWPRPLASSHSNFILFVFRNNSIATQGLPRPQFSVEKSEKKLVTQFKESLLAVTLTHIPIVV